MGFDSELAIVFYGSAISFDSKLIQSMLKNSKIIQKTANKNLMPIRRYAIMKITVYFEN